MKKEYAQFLLKKTQGDYNLIAQDFSRTRGNIWEETQFLFNPKENDTILDLGCGNGRYYNYFKDKGVKYVGVDKLTPDKSKFDKSIFDKSKFGPIIIFISFL